MRQQNEITIILEVKQDGEKLTGTVTQGEQKVEIKEGMVKGADVSFVVVRTRGDREIRTTYKGKLEGDVIKGVMITPGRDGGQARERPWEARRQK